jgi:hypothetical protein
VDKPPSAFLQHSVPGRLRIKVPGKRSDSEFFSRLERELAECPGVTGVSVTPLTGGVLIRHATDVEELNACVREHGLFELQPSVGPAARLLQDVSERLKPLNTTVSGVVGRDVDVNAIIFRALVFMAIFQLFRGRVLASAVTLLWYAYTLVIWTDMAGAKQVDANGESRES